MTPPALVVVGSYGMPGAVELQARLVRAHCGGVPVLVSDDRTAEAGPDGPGRAALLAGVCRREGLELVPADPARRLGHVAGDLAAFRHGIEAARDRGIPFVAKVSQRFLIDVPGWLAQAVEDMESLGAATASHPALYGHSTWFHLRTECVVMRAADWSAPEVLRALAPGSGGAAEQVVYAGGVRRTGASICGPRFFGPDRSTAYPGVWWHDSHRGPAGLAAAREVAGRYGVELGAGFHNGVSWEAENYRP